MTEIPSYIFVNIFKKYKGAIIFKKTIASILVFTFLITNSDLALAANTIKQSSDSATLSAMSRNAPIAAIKRDRDGNLYVAEDNEATRKFVDDFHSNGAFLYLNYLIGDAIYLKLNPDGLRGLIDRDLKHLHFEKFDFYSNISQNESDNSFVVPYTDPLTEKTERYRYFKMSENEPAPAGVKKISWGKGENRRTIGIENLDRKTPAMVTVLRDTGKPVEVRASAGEEAARVIDFEKIQDIEQRLLTGGAIDQKEFDNVYYSLAGNLLSPEARRIFYKIDAFHKMAYSEQGYMKWREASSRIGTSYFANAPFIREIYGTGYFHFHRYDARRRVFFSLLALLAGELSEEHFLKRIMPDYDYAVVFSEQSPKNWKIKKGMDYDMRAYFQHITAISPEWRELVSSMREQGVITDLNIMGKRALYEEYVRGFDEKGTLAADMYLPMPESVWQAVPVFVEDSDCEYIGAITDLLITPHKIATGKSSYVPERFKMNFLLNMLFKKGALSFGQIMNEIYDEIRRAERHAPLIDVCGEMRGFVRENWYDMVKFCMEHGLVTADVTGSYRLTERGRLAALHIRRQRESLFAYGLINRENLARIGLAERGPDEYPAVELNKSFVRIVTGAIDQTIDSMFSSDSSSSLRAKIREIFEKESGIKMDTADMRYPRIFDLYIYAAYKAVYVEFEREYPGLGVANYENFIEAVGDNIFNAIRNMLAIEINGNPDDIKDICNTTDSVMQYLKSVNFVSDAYLRWDLFKGVDWINGREGKIGYYMENPVTHPSSKRFVAEGLKPPQVSSRIIQAALRCYGIDVYELKGYDPRQYQGDRVHEPWQLIKLQNGPPSPLSTRIMFCLEYMKYQYVPIVLSATAYNKFGLTLHNLTMLAKSGDMEGVDFDVLYEEVMKCIRDKKYILDDENGEKELEYLKGRGKEILSYLMLNLETIFLFMYEEENDEDEDEAAGSAEEQKVAASKKRFNRKLRHNHEEVLRTFINFVEAYKKALTSPRMWKTPAKGRAPEDKDTGGVIGAMSERVGRDMPPALPLNASRVLHELEFNFSSAIPFWLPRSVFLATSSHLLEHRAIDAIIKERASKIRSLIKEGSNVEKVEDDVRIAVIRNRYVPIEVKRWLILDLGRKDNFYAISFLRSSLIGPEPIHDDNLREACVESLGAIGSEEVIPCLGIALSGSREESGVRINSDTSPIVRIKAAKVLGNIGNETALPYIDSVLRFASFLKKESSDKSTEGAGFVAELLKSMIIPMEEHPEVAKAAEDARKMIEERLKKEGLKTIIPKSPPKDRAPKDEDTGGVIGAMSERVRPEAPASSLPSIFRAFYDIWQSEHRMVTGKEIAENKGISHIVAKISITALGDSHLQLLETKREGVKFLYRLKDEAIAHADEIMPVLEEIHGELTTNYARHELAPFKKKIDEILGRKNKVVDFDKNFADTRNEEIRQVAASLRETLRRDPNMREVALAMPSLKGSKDPIAALKKWFEERGLNVKDFGMGRFSGLASSVIKRNFLYAGLRIHIPPSMSGKVKLVAGSTPVSEERKVKLADIAHPGNEIEIENVKEEDKIRLTYVRPDGEKRTCEVPLKETGTAGAKGRAERATSLTLSLYPVFQDFYDTVFSIPLKTGAEREKAVFRHIKKYGSKKSQSERDIVFRGLLVLPSFYKTHPGRIWIYRDRPTDTRWIVLCDKRNQENFVGYEWRDNKIISLRTGSEMPLEYFRITDRHKGTKQPAYYMHRSDVFGKFNDTLDKAVLRSGKVSPWSSRMFYGGIGYGKFGFRVNSELDMTTFEGTRASVTGKDREIYPLIFRRTDGKGEIRIRYRDPEVRGEFIAEGLTWQDGSPLVLKGRYFNLSTIVEMVRRNLLPGIRASDFLLETLDYHEGSGDDNTTHHIRSYRIDEGSQALVEDVYVHPATFEPWEKGTGYLEAANRPLPAQNIERPDPSHLINEVMRSTGKRLIWNSVVTAGDIGRSMDKLREYGIDHGEAGHIAQRFLVRIITDTLKLDEREAELFEKIIFLDSTEGARTAHYHEFVFNFGEKVQPVCSLAAGVRTAIEKDEPSLLPSLQRAFELINGLHSSFAAGQIAWGNPGDIMERFKRSAVRPLSEAAPFFDLQEHLNGLAYRMRRQPIMATNVDNFSNNAVILGFDGIAINDRSDRHKAIGGMLDFNTRQRSLAGQKDIVETELQRLLQGHFSKIYPGKEVRGLSLEILRAIRTKKGINENTRKSLYEEYLFHIIFCPLFGHLKTRKMAPENFPLNYANAAPAANKDEARDGLLTGIIREVRDKLLMMNEELDMDDVDIFHPEERKREEPPAEPLPVDTRTPPHRLAELALMYYKKIPPLENAYIKSVLEAVRNKRASSENTTVLSWISGQETYSVANITSSSFLSDMAGCMVEKEPALRGYIFDEGGFLREDVMVETLGILYRDLSDPPFKKLAGMIIDDKIKNFKEVAGLLKDRQYSANAANTGLILTLINKERVLISNINALFATLTTADNLRRLEFNEGLLVLFLNMMHEEIMPKNMMIHPVLGYTMKHKEALTEYILKIFLDRLVDSRHSASDLDIIRFMNSVLGHFPKDSKIFTDDVALSLIRKGKRDTLETYLDYCDRNNDDFIFTAPLARAIFADNRSDSRFLIKAAGYFSRLNPSVFTKEAFADIVKNQSDPTILAVMKWFPRKNSILTPDATDELLSRHPIETVEKVLAYFTLGGQTTEYDTVSGIPEGELSQSTRDAMSSSGVTDRIRLTLRERNKPVKEVKDAPETALFRNAIIIIEKALESGRRSGSIAELKDEGLRNELFRLIAGFNNSLGDKSAGEYLFYTAELSGIEGYPIFASSSVCVDNKIVADPALLARAILYQLGHLARKSFENNTECHNISALINTNSERNSAVYSKPHFVVPERAAEFEMKDAVRMERIDDEYIRSIIGSANTIISGEPVIQESLGEMEYINIYRADMPHIYGAYNKRTAERPDGLYIDGELFENANISRLLATLIYLAGVRAGLDESRIKKVISERLGVDDDIDKELDEDVIDEVVTVPEETVESDTSMPAEPQHYEAFKDKQVEFLFALNRFVRDYAPGATGSSQSRALMLLDTQIHIPLLSSDADTLVVVSNMPFRRALKEDEMENVKKWHEDIAKNGFTYSSAIPREIGSLEAIMALEIEALNIPENSVEVRPVDSTGRAWEITFEWAHPLGDGQPRRRKVIIFSETNILDKSTYPPGMRSMLMDDTEKFDYCFRIESGTDIFPSNSGNRGIYKPLRNEESDAVDSVLNGVIAMGGIIFTDNSRSIVLVQGLAELEEPAVQSALAAAWQSGWDYGLSSSNKFGIFLAPGERSTPSSGGVIGAMSERIKPEGEMNEDIRKESSTRTVLVLHNMTQAKKVITDIAHSIGAIDITVAWDNLSEELDRTFGSVSNFLLASNNDQRQFVIRNIGYILHNCGLMRYRRQLKVLEEKLPGIIAQKIKEGERTITISILGVHQGEEAVSVMVVLERIFKRYRIDSHDINFHIIGTDLSRDNIVLARDKIMGIAFGNDSYTIDDVFEFEMDKETGKIVYYDIKEREKFAKEATDVLKTGLKDGKIKVDLKEGNILDEEDLGDIVFCNQVAYTFDDDAIVMLRNKFTAGEKSRVIFSSDAIFLGLEHKPFIPTMYDEVYAYHKEESGGVIGAMSERVGSSSLGMDGEAGTPLQLVLARVNRFKDAVDPYLNKAEELAKKLPEGSDKTLAENDVKILQELEAVSLEIVTRIREQFNDVNNMRSLPGDNRCNILTALKLRCEDVIGNNAFDIQILTSKGIRKGHVEKDDILQEILNSKRFLDGLSSLTEVRLQSEHGYIYVPGYGVLTSYPIIVRSFSDVISSGSADGDTVIGAMSEETAGTFKALILDWDGTVVDTAEQWKEIWERIFEVLVRRDSTSSAYAAFMNGYFSRSVSENADMLIKAANETGSGNINDPAFIENVVSQLGLSEEVLERVLREDVLLEKIVIIIKEYALRKLTGSISAIGDSVAEIKKVRESGIEIYLVSGSPLNVLKACRDIIGLSGVIPDENIASGTDSGQNKAILFRRIIESRKLKEEEVTSIGDSVNDITAAKEAGISAIGLSQDESKTGKMKEAGADLVTDALKFDALKKIKKSKDRGAVSGSSGGVIGAMSERIKPAGETSELKESKFPGIMDLDKDKKANAEFRKNTLEKIINLGEKESAEVEGLINEALKLIEEKEENAPPEGVIEFRLLDIPTLGIPRFKNALSLINQDMLVSRQESGKLLIYVTKRFFGEYIKGNPVLLADCICREYRKYPIAKRSRRKASDPQNNYPDKNTGVSAYLKACVDAAINEADMYAIDHLSRISTQEHPNDPSWKFSDYVRDTIYFIRTNAILEEEYMLYDIAVKRIVNPDNKEGLIALYGGSGADISNFLLATNADEGYFVDDITVSQDKLKQALADWDNVVFDDWYTTYKHRRGYGEYTTMRQQDIHRCIVKELKAMGVDKESIKFPDTEDGPDKDGSFQITFRWTYPGSGLERTYKITFIKANITKPAEYPDSLNKVLNRKIDIYYQRAGMDIASDYNKFIDRIARALKRGGALIADSFETNGKEYSIPGALINNAEMAFTLPIASRAIKALSDGIVTKHNHYYGWNTRIQIKIRDGKNAVSVTPKWAFTWEKRSEKDDDADADEELTASVAGSIPQVFKVLLSAAGPMTRREIAEKLKREVSTIEPDLTGLVKHLGIAMRHGRGDDAAYELTPQAREYSGDITDVLGELYGKYGYRPKPKDIASFKWKIDRIVYKGEKAKIIFSVQNINTKERLTLRKGDSQSGFTHILKRHGHADVAAAEKRDGVYFPPHLSESQIRQIIRETVEYGYKTRSTEGHPCYRLTLSEKRAKETGIEVMHVGVSEHGEIITAYPRYGENIKIHRDGTFSGYSSRYWRWTESLPNIGNRQDIYRINMRQNQFSQDVREALEAAGIAKPSQADIDVVEPVLKRAAVKGSLRARGDRSAIISYAIQEELKIGDRIIKGVELDLLKEIMPYTHNVPYYAIEGLAFRTPERDMLELALSRIYNAIIMDIDSTITDDNKEVPQEMIEKIISEIERGVYVIMASGRPEIIDQSDRKYGCCDMNEVFERIRNNERVKKNPEILKYLIGFEQNGAHGFNGYARGDNRRVEIDRGFRIIERRDSEDIYNRLDTEFRGKLVFCQYRSHGVSILVKDEFRDKETISGMARRAREMLGEKSLDKYFDVLETECAVDIVPKGVSKAHAIQYATDVLGIPGSAIATIGDKGEPGGNDYEMLEREGGFCVGEYYSPGSKQVSLPRAIGSSGWSASKWLFSHLKTAAYGSESSGGVIGAMSERVPAEEIDNIDALIKGMWAGKMAGGRVFAYPLSPVHMQKERVGRFWKILNPGRTQYYVDFIGDNQDASDMAPVFSEHTDDEMDFEKIFSTVSPEVFLFSKELASGTAAFCVNKFPSHPYHFLLVPEPEKKYPQYLTEQAVSMALETMDLSNERLYFGFNSRGAWASINNLHLHGIYHPEALPIEDAEMIPYGDIDGCEVSLLRDYPAGTAVFSSDDRKALTRATMRFVKTLQDKNIPHNILMAKGKIYVFPKSEAGRYARNERYGYMELAGEIIGFLRAARFRGLTEDEIIGEMERVTIRGEALKDLLKETFGIGTVTPEEIIGAIEEAIGNRPPFAPPSAVLTRIGTNSGSGPASGKEAAILGAVQTTTLLPEVSWSGVRLVAENPDMDKEEFAFVGTDIGTMTQVRRVMYKGKIYVARLAKDGEYTEINEKLYIIPQARILKFISDMGIGGVLKAEHFLEFDDGGVKKKVILFEDMESAYGGMTLKRLISEKIRMGLSDKIEIARLMLKVLKVIRSLHEHGIYQWDVAFGNIWVTESGEILLFDFDFAFTKYDDIGELYKRGIHIFGTPLYRSARKPYENTNNLFPELDEIYACGIIFAQLLGYPLDDFYFPQKSMNREALVKWAEDANAPFRDIIKKAVLQDGDDAYQDMNGFVTELEDSIGHIGESARHLPAEEILQKPLAPKVLEPWNASSRPEEFFPKEREKERYHDEEGDDNDSKSRPSSPGKIQGRRIFSESVRPPVFTFTDGSSSWGMMEEARADNSAIANIRVRADRAKDKSMGIVIGIETSWFPEDQMVDVQPLLSELCRADYLRHVDLNNIRIVTGRGAKLAQNIIEAKEKLEKSGLNVPLKNIVIVGPEKVLLESGAFRDFISTDTEDKAFLACIDPATINSLSYKALLRTLAMATNEVEETAENNPIYAKRIQKRVARYTQRYDCNDLKTGYRLNVEQIKQAA